MKTIEWLPKHHNSDTMPIAMVPFCGYASDKMSVNSTSTILGSVSEVIQK
jgi:altronate dehydratase